MVSTAADYEEVQLCVEVFKNADTPLPSFVGSRREKLARDAGLEAHLSMNGVLPSLLSSQCNDLATTDETALSGSNAKAAQDVPTDEDVDDDGSWESIDSDEETIEDGEARSTQTTEIYKYFKKHTYDPARL